MEILYSDEDVDLSVEYLEETNSYFLHSTIRNWSLSKYKKYLKVLAVEMEKLKNIGAQRVYALPPTYREEKWETLFGFEDTGFVVGTSKLMVLNLWEQD